MSPFMSSIFCAGLIEIPHSCTTHGKRQRKSAPLPIGVKWRLAVLTHDRAEILHTAHVVDAVHAACLVSADFGKPVPIIESRVTSEASSSSLQPSVPAGRIGNTR